MTRYVPRLMVLVSVLLLPVGSLLAQVPEPAPPPAPETQQVSKEEMGKVHEELDSMREEQSTDRQRIGELEAEVKRLREEQDKEKKKEKKKKATVLGFYSASMTSTFSEKDPLNFALNEMEVDVGASATDWLTFRADLQVRPESPDPEENRHTSESESNAVDSLSGRRLLDHLAEQGYMAVTLYKPMDLVVHVGKFNAEFSMDPFDQVEGTLISRSLVYLHGMVQSLTGAKVGINLVPALRVELVVAEGWNLNLDNNRMPSFGGKVRLTLPKRLEAGISGYYGEDVAGASTDLSGLFVDNEVPRAALSGYARLHLRDWRISAEGCWGRQTVTTGTGDLAAEDDQDWFGGTFKADYGPLSWLELALRYELFSDNEGGILPLPALTNEGVMVHGPSIGARLKVANGVYVMTEVNAKLANEEVLTRPDGELGKYELFFGSQLLFRFGETPDDGKASLAGVLGWD